MTHTPASQELHEKYRLMATHVPQNVWYLPKQEQAAELQSRLMQVIFHGLVQGWSHEALRGLITQDLYGFKPTKFDKTFNTVQEFYDSWSKGSLYVPVSLKSVQYQGHKSISPREGVTEALSHVLRWHAYWSSQTEILTTGDRVVVSGIARQAWNKGRRFYGTGVRAAALGSGLMDDQHIPAHLDTLKELGALKVISLGRGSQPNLYELTIPSDAEVETPTHAYLGVPALFQEVHGLGYSAWFVYTTLQTHGSLNVTSLAKLTGTARGTVMKALSTLAEHGLVVRTRNSYEAVTADLNALAEDTGAHERFEARVEQYRQERKVYRAGISSKENGFTVGDLLEASGSKPLSEPVTRPDFPMPALRYGVDYVREDAYTDFTFKVPTSPLSQYKRTRHGELLKS